MLGLLAYAIVLGPPSLSTPQNTTYYLADGEVMEGYDVGASRKWISLDEMPEEVLDATLAIEDHRFYDHFGFDFKRIASAALTDLKTMELSEGASTITQQYARNLYLSHEKTWLRKLKEAFYAIRLEIFYDKDEILEGYMNTIYYGHGAYGIESASRYFFNKHASDLTLAESTMLAGVPKGPSYYSPLADEENAESRQAQILSRMNDLEFITNSEKDEAVTASLNYYDHSSEEAKAVGPYFQDEVVKEAARLLDVEVEAVESGGFHIYTTLNPEHQSKLEEALKEEFGSASEIETAAVIMDNDTGAVTAMAGGRDYSASSFNRATQAERMVGSTIKPFLYYAALQEGYSPLTMQESKPTSFELEDGDVYSPSNYNNYYAEDEITMAQALALSDNIYAVKTNLELGPKKLAKTMNNFGFKEDLPAVPSIALGTPSLSLYDMVNGYSKLTGASSSVEKHTITKITDHRENVLYEYEPVSQDDFKVDKKDAFSVTHMMTGIFDSALNGYMNVTGSSIAGELSRTYGGKSGTTDSDSWMIGFSPQYVMGVWSGYDDNRKITQPRDQQYSKELWANTMERIHEDEPVSAFSPPKGLRGVYINPESGKLSGPSCPEERLVYLEKKDIPKETCEGEDADINEIEEDLENDPWYKNIVDWFQ
ncbi:transglycosylase domain-containing protein [Halobacillus andaensis]|uniref:transglycosylase domain-containing protein n=1 Tax=Halobacillus andaensis TaxID=1176239 RepID=UPI003D718BA3